MSIGIAQVLKRNARDHQFFGFLIGFHKADPAATKHKAIMDYKHFYEDDREVNNLYSIYDRMMKDFNDIKDIKFS